MGFDNEASVEMQRLSYSTETVLSKKITRNISTLDILSTWDLGPEEIRAISDFVH